MDVPKQIKSLALVAAATFVALSVLCFGGEDWQPQPIGPFGTLNNRDNSFAISADKAQDLLNVELTPGGKSVRRRKGYGLAYALTITTSPVHGVYTFFDANGNTIDLMFNDTSLSSSLGGNSATVLFSTGPLAATYQCTDSLGFAYCANSSRTTLTKTNGATYSSLTTVSSTGTMVAACPTRLAMAGFSDRPSAIDFSAETDFTTWGTGSLGTSAAQFTVNAPGAKITHITYAFNRLMWFKNSSFGYILIGNQPAQSDWVIKTISYDVGTNDNSSVYREGILYFRGSDSHIYSFDGSNYQRLTKEVSSTINLSQNRITNLWTQTTQGDFQADTSSPTDYLSTNITAGSVVLATAAAASSFLDDTTVDFTSGTLTNLSTYTTSGFLYLALSSESTKTQYFPGTSGTGCNGFGESGHQFIPTSNYLTTSVTIPITIVGSPTATLSVYLRADSFGTSSTILAAKDITSATYSGGGNLTVTWDAPVVLTSGTTYWVTFFNGYTDSSNYVSWNGAASADSLLGDCQGAIGATFANLKYKINGKTYSNTGNIVSRSFDIGFSTSEWIWSWNGFTVISSTPTGTSLTFQTQTSSDNVTWEALASVTNGSNPTSTINRYTRYKASFSGTDNATPYIDYVNIGTTRRTRPRGSLYSLVNSAPSLTTWDSFQATTQNNGGSHTFYIRAATVTFAVLNSTPSWTAITPGSIPTITTGTYIQIRDDFAATAYTDAPKLDDFTLKWFEGLATDKAYATYFDDKIIWAITYGTASTTNNRLLIYDVLNQGWLIHDIAANGFFVRQNRLYFGSASSGNVYKYGDVDNDAGAAINSYWKSKDFFGGNPFTTQELATISLVSKSVANSTMTVTYTTDGQTSSSYNFSCYNSSSAFVDSNRNLSQGTVGSSYNVKVGNNAVDQPWEVFGIQIGIRSRSWKPTP